MTIGVRVEPELERALDQLAQSKGLSRSACIREAIRLYVQHFADGEEARRQSLLIQRQASRQDNASENADAWSEQVPDWADWTA